jgi:hypothetical protein
MRTMAGEQAAVIVMDEPVGGSFAARNEDTEWFMYDFSVLHCLPASTADIPSAATGTVSGNPARVCGECRLSRPPHPEIENPCYSFYRLIA